ncbi:MAG: hypothetical protein QOD86_2023 [Miltoncostaeaceae bacterium]|nr:hypothetical protein [Miltoncostaeaceae bacterium]
MDDERRDDRERRFQALWQEHHALVLAYARRRAPAEARDVVAETFLVAWQKLYRVPSEPVPWLLAVARNVLRDHQRRAQREVHARQRLSAEPEPWTRDPAERLPTRALATAFATLAARDREVLALVAWEGLTPDEAGRVLGISRPALAVRMHRARRRLARALEQLDDTPLGPPTRSPIQEQT